MLTENEAQERARQLAKDGKLIEAGWVRLMLPGAPDDFHQHHLDLIRFSFFRGARHMLALMTGAHRSLSEEHMARMIKDLQLEFETTFAAIDAKYVDKARANGQH